MGLGKDSKIRPPAPQLTGHRAETAGAHLSATRATDEAPPPSGEFAVFRYACRLVSSLWRRRGPSGATLLDMEAVGTVRVETHNGSLLTYRFQRNPTSGRPEVVIMGELPIFAEIIQRLTSANDGTNITFGYNFLFPHNLAMESLRLWASPQDPNLPYRHVDTVNFANAAVVRLRFDPATGLYEGIYTVPAEKFVPGIGHDHIPLLDPKQIPAIWLWVLARYLEDKTHERIVSVSVNAKPSAHNLAEAFREVAGLAGGGTTAQSYGIMARSDGELEKIVRSLPQGAWTAEVGVKLDPSGRVSAIFVRIYTRYPRGMWGPVDNLRKMSSAIEFTGRPSGDGRRIEWSTQSYGQAEPNFAAMLGTAVAEHAMGGDKAVTAVKWEPPPSHRPIPSPMDEFPRPPRELSPVSIGDLIVSPPKKRGGDDDDSGSGGAPPAPRQGGALPGVSTGGTPTAGTLPGTSLVPNPTAMLLIGAQVLMMPRPIL